MNSTATASAGLPYTAPFSIISAVISLFGVFGNALVVSWLDRIQFKTRQLQININEEHRAHLIDLYPIHSNNNRYICGEIARH